MRFIRNIVVAAALFSGTGTAFAGEVEIVAATAKPGTNGTYAFNVTLKHGDTGWDHYANAWDVVAEDGTVLGTRTLHHPHVDEQPFTRSLKGVKVPKGTKTVTIRAYDKVHGISDATFTVKLKAKAVRKIKRKRKRRKSRGSH